MDLFFIRLGRYIAEDCMELLEYFSLCGRTRIYSGGSLGVVILGDSIVKICLIES